MAILRITFSNLRKKKGAALSLGILVILTSLLLNIGINMMLNAENIIQERIEALHGAHFITLLSTNTYMPEYRTFFEEDTRVTEIEVEQVIAMDLVKTQFGNGDMELGALIQNIETKRAILPFMPIGQGEEIPSDALYLPIGMKDASPAIGEAYPITYKNKTYTYTVAGYFETPFFGTANSGIIKYYLCEEAFRKLSDEIGTSKMISTCLKNPEEANALKADFTTYTDGDLSRDMVFSAAQITYSDMRYIGTIIPSIFSMCILVFAAIILLVVALVAKFHISANIEDNIHNIGVLGAMGYTSGQIIYSVLLEFTMLAAGGAAAGVLLARASMPALGGMLTSVSGVIWNGNMSVSANFLSIVFLILFVLLVTLADALRIRKLPPVIALRGGLATHSFHKNRFALNKSGNVNLRLAGKYASLNPRQNILIAIVTAGVTFIMMLMLLLYNNMVKDQTALIRMCGTELSDVIVRLTNHTDADRLEQQIMQRDGVRKTSMSDEITTLIAGKEIMTKISYDYSKMETLNVYEGELPLYENETVITGVMADQTGKKIGNTIEIQYGGVTAEYVICGLTQSTNQGGMLCLLTLDGMRRMEPFYRQQSINVYLNQGIDIDTFTEELTKDFSVLPTGLEEDAEETENYAELDGAVREKMANLLTMYGIDSLQYALMKDGKIILSGSSEDYTIERIENNRSRIQAQIYSMCEMLRSLTQVIAIFSILIIALILNMLVRVIIRKRQQEFAVMRSFGYTSSQLSIQIIGGIFPAAIAGTIIGGILSKIFVIPFFSIIFYNVGITDMLIVIHPCTIIAICCVVLFTVLFCTFISAGRIRRLSVYTLLAE